MDATEPLSEKADEQGTVSAWLPLGYYLIEVGENYLLMTGSVFPKYENGAWVAVGSTASAKQEASSDLTLTTDGTSVTVGELVNYTLTLKAPSYPDDATQTGPVHQREIAGANGPERRFCPGDGPAARHADSAFRLHFGNLRSHPSGGQYQWPVLRRGLPG